MSTDRELFTVSTAQNVALQFDVAGLGDRFIASLIDYTVLFASGIALLIVLKEGAGLVWGRSLFLL